MNLGSMEVLVIAIVLGTVLIVIVGGVFIATSRSRAPGPAITPVQLTPELEQQLHQLVDQGKPIHAIKILREHTGLDLRTSKSIVDSMQAGHDPAGHPALATGRRHVTHDDLATRVRQLKETGRTEQAVFLVRGETGMDHNEATLFVNSL